MFLRFVEEGEGATEVARMSPVRTEEPPRPIRRGMPPLFHKQDELRRHIRAGLPKRSAEPGEDPDRK
jgi:hypothetical protein